MIGQIAIYTVMWKGEKGEKLTDLSSYSAARQSSRVPLFHFSISIVLLFCPECLLSSAQRKTRISKPGQVKPKLSTCMIRYLLKMEICLFGRLIWWKCTKQSHALFNKASSLRTFLFTAKPGGWRLPRFTPPTPGLLLSCIVGYWAPLLVDCAGQWGNYLFREMCSILTFMLCMHILSS